MDESVELFDGIGLVAEGVVVGVDGSALRVKVTACETRAPSRPSVSIAAPPIKGARCETMVDQLSQIGAARWIPLLTERTVVNPRPGRIDKWRRIVIESAKQCGRAHLMTVDQPTPITTLLGEPSGRLLLADAGGGPMSGLTPALDRDEPVVVIIGPEGGLTEDERESVRQSAASEIRLGPFVLRVETAAVAAAVALLGT